MNDMKKLTKLLKKTLTLLLALLLMLSLAGCAEVAQVGLEILDEALTESLEEGIAEGLPAETEDAPEEAAEAAPTAAPTEKPTEKPTQEPTPTASPAVTPEPTKEAIPEEGSYTTREDVALYLHTYGHLPENFITKKEAEALGWPGGDLTPYAPGKCIGGNHFGNYQGLLPAKAGRTYQECDIDTLGKTSRGAKRLIYSNDGLIYYTEDHYESFTLLYGEE